MKLDHPQYFLAWLKHKRIAPRVMPVCAWNRQDAIQAAEKQCALSWKEIYKLGGRIVRVKMRVV